MIHDFRHREPPESPQFTRGDLAAARLELAVEFLAPLIEADPALPGPVRMRLTSLVTKLRELAPLVRGIEG